jgi:hypothetical protein
MMLRFNAVATVCVRQLPEGLGRSPEVEASTRPPDSIQLSIEHSDSFGTSLIILELEMIEGRVLFQRFDLQVNQLKDFSFDGRDCIRNHLKFLQYHHGSRSHSEESTVEQSLRLTSASVGLLQLVYSAPPDKWVKGRFRLAKGCQAKFWTA